MKDSINPKELVGWLKAQSEVYCQCPRCREFFRLNEARLTFGNAARKDLVDKLREKEELFEIELDERIAEVRKAFRNKSRAVSKGQMLEHLYPYIRNFKYNPKDARFIGNPIDYVVFDGLFSTHRVNELTILEVKTGSSSGLNLNERAVKRAVEKGRVNFEVIKLK